MQKYKPIASTSFSMQRTTTIAQLSRPTRTSLSRPAIARRNFLNACFKRTLNAGLKRVLPSSSSPTSMRKETSSTFSSRRNLLVRRNNRTKSIWVVLMRWRASMPSTWERWGWAWSCRIMRGWCDLSRQSVWNFSVRSNRWVRWALLRNISLHLINIIKLAPLMRTGSSISYNLDLFILYPPLTHLFTSFIQLIINGCLMAINKKII